MGIMKSVVVVLLLIALASAFPSFMNEIPNGHKVPNPCKAGFAHGVGHVNTQGTGDRNQFGKDFLNGSIWSEWLCRRDSDGDHKTNGEELGVPNCTWKKGDTPAKPATGHPGFCEDKVHPQRCKNQGTHAEEHGILAFL